MNPSTTPPDNTSTDDITRYLQAVFPDGTGTLHWGTMVPRTDNYTANIAAWPAIREVIPAAMLRESAQHDVYVCPYLGSTKKRAKGKAQLR